MDLLELLLLTQIARNTTDPKQPQRSREFPLKTKSILLIFLIVGLSSIAIALVSLISGPWILILLLALVIATPIFVIRKYKLNDISKYISDK